MQSAEKLDPGELERALRQLVVDRLRVFAGALTVWCVIQVVVLAATWELSWELHGSSVMVVIVAVAAWWFSRGDRFGSSTITGIGVVVGLVQLVSLALLAQITGERTFFWIVPLAFVGAGLLVLHRLWLLCYLTLGMAISLSIARVPGYSLWSDTILLLAGAFISVLLHVVGRRAVVNVETLRARDRQQKLALEAALAGARRELADRQRAEAEGDRLREQFVQAQKMEAVGTLAGGFAHDMNNVLGGILAVAELLREDVPAQLREEVDGIIDSTQRGAELTRNLLGFARRGQYRRERVQLTSVIGDLVRLLTRTVPKGVTFETDVGGPGLVVEGDPTLITQALVNLCLNSVDAMRGVGRIAINAARVDLDPARASELDVAPGGYVSIQVTDSGSGMDAATIKRIFEPFFTTKEVGRGTGLGLPMVYGTVRSHKGGIDVTSSIGAGTTMTLYLPVAELVQPIQPPGPSVTPVVPEQATKGTILVVDDDKQIRKVARRILEGRGYRVLEAGDGRAALDVYQLHPDIQLVLLDMAMPVMGGAECFAALRQLDAKACVLLASGYTIEEDARSCLANGAVGFLDKPYTVDALTSAVSRGLRGDGRAVGEETGA